MSLTLKWQRSSKRGKMFLSEIMENKEEYSPISSLLFLMKGQRRYKDMQQGVSAHPFKTTRWKNDEHAHVW